MDLTPLQIALLTGAAFLAGLVDAIAGGGGLVTLPALLAAGVPPHFALGTNKGQSVFGSFAATLRFARAGMLDRHRARLTFPLGLAGSLLGAQLVLWIRPDALRPLVLGMLCMAAGVVAVQPAGMRQARPVAGSPALTAALLALVIGTYDGFFGPGTGTFLILAFVMLLGLTPTQASADAKVVNFASNLAAVALFASRGLVLWQVALPMALAQFVGGWIGAHLAIKRGDGLVRAVVLAVVAALVVKLGVDFLRA